MAITKPTTDLAASQLQVETGPLEDYTPAEIAGEVTTTGIYVGPRIGNEIADLYTYTAPAIRDYIYWDYFHRPHAPDRDVSILCYDIARGSVSMPAGRIKLLYSVGYETSFAANIRDEILKIFEDIEKSLAANKRHPISTPTCPMCGGYYSGGNDEPYAWTPATCEFADAPKGAELDSGPWNCWSIPTHEVCEADPDDIRPWTRPAYWPFIPSGNELPGYHLPKRRLTEDCVLTDLGQLHIKSSTPCEEWIDMAITRRDGYTHLKAGTTRDEFLKVLSQKGTISAEDKILIHHKAPGIAQVGEHIARFHQCH